MCAFIKRRSENVKKGHVTLRTLRISDNFFVKDYNKCTRFMWPSFIYVNVKQPNNAQNLGVKFA